MKINSGTFLSYLQLKESKNNSVQRLVEEDPQSDNQSDNTQAAKSKCLVISKDYGFIPEHNAIVYNGKGKQSSIGDIISIVIKLKEDKKDELFSEDKLSIYDKSSVSNIEKFRDASSCVEGGELQFKLVIVNGEITGNTSIPMSSSQVPDFNITIDNKSGISNLGYNLPDYVNGNVILTNITQTSGSTNNSFKEIIGDNLVIDGCKNINLSILPALANNNWILSNVKIINSELANGTLQGFKNLSVTTLDIENTNITTLNDAPTKFEKLSGQQSERSEQLKGKTTGARIKNNSSLTSFGNWNPTGLIFLQIVNNAKLNKEDVTKFETAIKTNNPDIQIVHDSIVEEDNRYLVNVSLTPADFEGRITNGEVSKPIEMGEGEHNIDCSGLDLKSFKNFPKKINGNLIAKDLKNVKTLEFFPEEITKDVDLSGTDLDQNAFDSIPNNTPKTVTIKGHLYLNDIKNLKTSEKQTGEIIINTDIFKVDLYKVKGIEVSKEPPFKKEGDGEKTVLKATGTPVTPESLAAYIDKKTKTIIYPIDGEVNGDFDCHGMSLVSFKNFPKTIKGDLVAYKNNFDSFILIFNNSSTDLQISIFSERIEKLINELPQNNNEDLCFILILIHMSSIYI